MPSSPALKLPDISSIPLYVSPTIELIDPVLLQKWASFLTCLKPDISMEWQPGTPFVEVCSDLLTGAVNGVEEYSQQHGLNTSSVHYVVSDEITLFLQAFTEQDYPIFYEEFLQYVRTKAPGMVPLIKTAISLLGVRCRTWEDIIRDAEERYEMELQEDERDEFQMEMQKQLEYMKSCVPKKSPFHKTIKGLPQFRKQVNQYHCSNHEELRVLNWLKHVIDLCSFNNTHLECMNENFNDGPNIDFRSIMPILYSRDDAITEYYCNDIDDAFNAGYYIGVELYYNHERDPMVGLQSFLSDIRLLGKYQEVFKNYYEVRG